MNNIRKAMIIILACIMCASGFLMAERNLKNPCQKLN